MLKALDAAEAIYSHFYRKRREKFERRAAVDWSAERCAVISVGNITTGGTGKTPAVQWVARLLQEQEARVAVVARGYGGQLSDAGAIVSDGATTFLNARQAGDEPLLHARALPGVPVIIGRDRVVAVRRAVQSFNVSAVVLDDGFQYWSLRRAFDLVLVDARRPFDNGHLLPRGHLREPAAALGRSHAVLMTRADLATDEQRAATRLQIARFTQSPVFEACHAPVLLRDETNGGQLDLNLLRSLPVCALSALADNETFAATLQRCGAQVVTKMARRDHHWWHPSEVERAARQAAAAGAKAVVTTEKDAVKLQAGWLRPLPLWSLVIELSISDGESEGNLRSLIASIMRRVQSAG